MSRLGLFFLLAMIASIVAEYIYGDPRSTELIEPLLFVAYLLTAD